jgi:uncharacterized protein YkwD
VPILRGVGIQRRPRRIVAALVAAAAFLVPAGQAGAAELSAKDRVERALVVRINDVRADHGLPALRVASPLTSAATRHANSMGSRGYFRHELRKKADWISFGTWIHWYWPGPDYTAWTAGENLAWGAPDLGARATVNMWMDSPGHRANLLGAWRRIGVAVVHVTAPAGYYRDYPEVTIVAADFGTRSG